VGDTYFMLKSFISKNILNEYVNLFCECFGKEWSSLFPVRLKGSVYEIGSSYRSSKEEFSIKVTLIPTLMKKNTYGLFDFGRGFLNTHIYFKQICGEDYQVHQSFSSIEISEFHHIAKAVSKFKSDIQNLLANSGVSSRDNHPLYNTFVDTSITGILNSWRKELRKK